LALLLAVEAMIRKLEVTPRLVMASETKDCEVRIAYDQWHRDRASDDNLLADLKNPWNSFVCANLAEVAGKVVLEIGCGRGQLTRYLAAKGAKVVGADFSQEALTIARKRTRNNKDRLTLINADAGFIPLKDKSVDLVISCETIEHTSDPTKVLAEFHRVLKPNGRLMLTFPNCLNMSGLYRIYLWIRGRPYDSGASIQPIEQALIAFRILAKLRKIGFRILGTHGSVYNLLIPGFAPLRLTVVERIPLLRTLAKPFAIHFGLIAKRSR
jgi:SAM-dependent methyltransferase